MNTFRIHRIYITPYIFYDHFKLHRTKADPNCELIELEDGEGAIVSCRNIKAGEFFCILESDDDYESGDEDQSLDDNEEDYCCQYVSS